MPKHLFPAAEPSEVFDYAGSWFLNDGDAVDIERDRKCHERRLATWKEAYSRLTFFQRFMWFLGMDVYVDFEVTLYGPYSGIGITD